MGLPGDKRIVVSACMRALSAPLHPMRLRIFASTDGVIGDVGDLSCAFMHVADRLRISVRRGNNGDEGVGDWLVSTTGTVATGEVFRRGDTDREASRRATEFEERMDATEAADMLERGDSGEANCDARGVGASSSSKHDRRDRVSELVSTIGNAVDAAAGVGGEVHDCGRFLHLGRGAGCSLNERASVLDWSMIE
jgi:hypothetical protein